ncbi:MAG: monooxygenase [Burkholderiales bacterium RIFCSPHIGHO2_02_FULL_66_10]|jgi:toluene monooxygenase system protein D|uniref:MmoB/DmpM family protein n=1 Tax=Hydrogenophaga TaxID=47420 RepID=UPI0003F46F2E|nr:MULTISPECIES: MmoB/DmpM family protein [Hydrogenophaga]EWS63926.1 Toluene-4-monooxygenase system protein D [Hydrogenophaga sp. T4]OGB13986.1 MAG: monooxygenase [Burkholderiales bacterium RIFCSPHIGHO2_02_FULL_66_10]OGB34823.1 MAG: monooxygenase [Burkholderiales bacterium RIFCSPLOWO2_02_FULL_66_35]MDO9029649.1 MmoB/DmpM family protein [Hydrogenophaga sp.]UCU94662.1 MmoB/DmpM family protein [Hydrogenophaga taeniospiralis]
MSDTTTAEAYRNNRVGPVLRASPLTAAVIEAAEEDNPDKTIRVDDKVAYVRIDCEGELILRRETLERALGRPFRMSELEVELGSFAGRIETTEDHVRFYFNKTL